VIEIRDLVHVYPNGTRAIDGVGLNVADGERLAIIGQNGSGKSTLVRHLNGLLRPTSGEVLIDGTSTTDRRVAALAAHVGLVFQNPDRQIFAGRVQVEVAFGPRNLGLRGAKLNAVVADALAAVGLSEQADSNPYDLGFSKRKLLALASVLAMSTPTVVLDEPTTGQDLRGVEQIQRLVANLSGSGRTVIAVSHDMRFVAETFARVVVMEAGRVTLDGTPAEVFSAGNWDALARTYVEPPLASRIGARLGLGSTPTDDTLVEALVARRGD
jgi:energy-coupling factor transport system ATP-binding protein